jgi:hypothetical protein
MAKARFRRLISIVADDREPTRCRDIKPEGSVVATRARWRVEFLSIDVTDTVSLTGEAEIPADKGDDESCRVWMEGWRAKGVDEGTVESSSSLTSREVCDGAGEGKAANPFKDRELFAGVVDVGEGVVADDDND